MKMRRKTLLTTIFIFIAISLIASLSFAGLTGTIKGKVIDMSGNAVADVIISVLGPDGGVKRTVDTNKKGSYRLVEIMPGKYTLTAEKEGYAKETKNNVPVSINKTITVDFTLVSSQLK